MSKLFSCDYGSLLYGTMDHCYMVKCRRNVNFEEMDTERSTRKIDGFWLIWGICKDYIKQNIIMAVLRKANSHSVVIFRIDRKNK